MSPRNGSGSTRSSSRNKSGRKEPHTADHNAQQTNSQAPPALSTPRDKKLPAVKKTKTKSPLPKHKTTSQDNVSELSFTFVDTDNIDKDSSSVQELYAHNTTSHELNKDDTESPVKTVISPPPKVGDNRDSLAALSVPQPAMENPPSSTPTIPSPPAPSLHSSPGDPWHTTFNELQVMRARMGTLEKVEAATLDFAQQLQALRGEASATEERVSANADKIKAMGEEITKLRTTVEKQQNTIKDLHKMREDFKNISRTNVSEMNALVEQQRQQVQSIESLKKGIVSDTQHQKEQLKVLQTSQEASQKKLQQQITQAKEGADHKALLDEAFKKRHNLILIGLPENENHSDISEVSTFFKNKLKLKKVHIAAAYRLGNPPQDGRSYIRPVLVKFSKLTDRNMVWRKRHDVPQNEDQTKTKIRADLPKKLRDNVQILYRVINAASNMEDFKTAVIRDFAVVLHGKHYISDNLELLPPPIRPSSLAVRESDEALAFFSRFCFLSNHYPSQFKLDGITFHNVEHFLAYKKAQISQQDDIIQRALRATDPVEAKSILNSLHKDYAGEWEKIREEVATLAIRNKFSQNNHLADLLRDTRNLLLGEASKDPAWGIGYTLEDQEVLQVTKWNQQGNLLGSILMKIRTELSKTTAS